MPDSRSVRMTTPIGTANSGANEHSGAAMLRSVLDSAMRGPGAYRVEVYVVPRHLLHLLGENPAPYAREYPYLYTAPIYVR